MTMNKIKHIRQPTDYTCVLASVAMSSHIPLVRVIATAKKTCDHNVLEMGLNSNDTHNLLVALGLKFEHTWPAKLNIGNVYLASVPSLNKEATFHSVCFNMQDVFEVLDPQKGRPGKKYYDQFEKNDPLARRICSYGEVIKIG